ncbi:COG3014 family protein [Wenyingzhuangia sp. IMCC45574]
MRKSIQTYLFYLFIALGFASCATYHDLSVGYQQQIQNENYQSANAQIEKNKFLKKKRNRLLSYLEKGKLAHLQKNYTLSNELFNKADVLIEDHKKNFGKQVLGALTNPEKENYKAEDFEKVAIHYYKALNYIFLRQFDEALVEAKRINLQLQKINDKYPAGKKNRYTSDAFALNLQGILYEATGNINDAFISYRNAIELYKKNEGVYFGVAIPTQLKQDVINTAHLLGFTDQEIRYAKEFNLKYQPEAAKGNSLLVFWESGLVPYKSQTYFTFTEMPGSYNGFMTITNKELGLDIPIPSTRTKRKEGGFSNFSIVNVAFPKYEVRPSLYTRGEVIIEGAQKDSIQLELVQDYNVIAKQTLKDRTVREIGKVAIRLATKKLSEAIVTDQNKNLGALVGLFNAVTEKTDTRNWQTLPGQIYYARIPVKNDTTKVVLKTTTPNGTVLRKSITVDSKYHINFLTYNTHQIIRSN